MRDTHRIFFADWEGLRLGQHGFGKALGKEPRGEESFVKRIACRAHLQQQRAGGKMLIVAP